MHKHLIGSNGYGRRTKKLRDADGLKKMQGIENSNNDGEYIFENSESHHFSAFLVGAFASERGN